MESNLEWKHAIKACFAIAAVGKKKEMLQFSHWENVKETLYAATLLKIALTFIYEDAEPSFLKVFPLSVIAPVNESVSYLLLHL